MITCYQESHTQKPYSTSLALPAYLNAPPATKSLPTPRGILLHRLPHNRIIPQPSYSPETQATPSPTTKTPSTMVPARHLHIQVYIHTYITSTRTYVFLAATFMRPSMRLTDERRPTTSRSEPLNNDPFFYTASLCARARTLENQTIKRHCYNGEKPTHPSQQFIPTKKMARGKNFVHMCSM